MRAWCSRSVCVRMMVGGDRGVVSGEGSRFGTLVEGGCHGLGQVDLPGPDRHPEGQFG